MLHETHHVAGIAVLVVIPGHQLHEGTIQRNTCPGIKDGSLADATEIRGDNLVVGVSQGALHRTF